VHSGRKADLRTVRFLLQAEELAASTAVAIAQARAALGPWVAQLRNWDIYGTFTYDPARVQWSQGATVDTIIPPSPDASRRHVHLYLQQLTEELGREVGAFCALETTRRGWPHWHALIAAGGLDQSEFKSAMHLWFDTRGFARLDRVDRQDTAGVAAYVGKYLCKEDGDVILWGKLAGEIQPGQLRLRYERAREEMKSTLSARLSPISDPTPSPQSAS
jgi:hypothetical protein